MDNIPFEALFDEGQAADERLKGTKALARADVIIGVDAASQHEFTVFGTPPLEETVRMGSEQALRTVRVTLRHSRGELDKLVALVKTLKGLRAGGASVDER